MTELVSLQHVNKRYGAQAVLSDVKLTVNAGEILGLVGPNGAGKSTCLHALLGLTSFDGNISVNGHKPSQNREKMLHEVAYISDVAVLPKWLKVNQAIDYVSGVHPNFDKEKALGFLSKTNIALDSKIKALSKGMVTQVHLALVLAIDAKVLVLDEPTLGLDILTRRQFYDHLLEDFYSEDKCIIVTTHQIDEIENILTHVAFIKDGSIVFHDSVDNIRSRYQLLAVTNDKKSQAQELSPLVSNSIMGMTTMLFDNENRETLESIGTVSSPTLEDVFVGVMTKEAVA